MLWGYYILHCESCLLRQNEVLSQYEYFVANLPRNPHALATHDEQYWKEIYVISVSVVTEFTDSCFKLGQTQWQSEQEDIWISKYFINVVD